MDLDVVILAAGKGKRMHSLKPKVLHPIAGKPMLSHVIDTAKALNPKNIFIVYGHEGEVVREHYRDDSLTWVLQKEQLGTGHAVMQVLEHAQRETKVLVLSADVPLLSLETLSNLSNQAQKSDLALLTAVFNDPTGLGRIIRDKQGDIKAIIEHKDASADERAITEIYSGIMIANVADLRRLLPQLKADNAQAELYLTDIVSLAVRDGLRISGTVCGHAYEVQGVNDREQLEEVERRQQRVFAKVLMRKGVTIADSQRIDIRGQLECANDVYLDINCVFEGHVIIETGVVIEANCVIKNAHIKKGARILSHSVIDGAVIGEEASVGPFARLRPDTVLHAKSKVGNFVEIKKTTLGIGAKASHLSYVGDSEVGEQVNIGAGTITCNYDGAFKHKTIIDKGAFIGSGTQLVAPVHVGENATVGAGTTLRKDAPAEKLTLSVKEQRTLDGWQRPEKDK